METEKKLKIDVELVFPTPERNKDEAVIINSDSPLTSSTPIDQDIIIQFSPRTPKCCFLFDPFAPFAPAPHNLILPPRVHNFLTDSNFRVARRLNFAASSNDIVKDVVMLEEEQVLLDKMYKSLFDFIVAKQVQGLVVVVEKDGFETPPKCGLLSGVADTCPAAPRKARLDGMERVEGVKKLGLDFKRIDMGLCRKLNFYDEEE